MNENTKLQPKISFLISVKTLKRLYMYHIYFYQNLPIEELNYRCCNDKIKGYIEVEVVHYLCS